MRRKPYTEIGIGRIPCARCGQKPSKHQWNICADGNQYRAICVDCDVALNELVLKFMNFTNVPELIEKYKTRLTT